MTRGAAAIRTLPEGAWLLEPRTVLAEIANALRRALGGSSGPFYAVALMRAARTLPEQPSPLDWSNALTAGTNAIAELGGAKPGDRTMLDALDAAAKGFAAELGAGKPATGAWRTAVDAARAATAATAQMYPKLGRASYLGERAVGVPDAGAEAVVIWMDAVWPPQP
jgi:dihydroxyacetone kinase